jgi:hypothetical protein
MDDKNPGFLDETLLNQPDTPPAPAHAEPPKAPELPKTEPAALPAAAPVATAPTSAPVHSGPATNVNPVTGQPAAPDLHMAPIPALLDERDKRKKAEDENAALKRQLEGLQRQNQPQGPNLAELMSKDPDAYHRHVMGEAAQLVRTQILEANLTAAAGRHGQVFDEAYEAVLQAGPAVVQECLAKPDPGEAIVNWHKRHQTLSGLPDTFYADPDAWVRQRYAELAAQAAQPALGKPPVQPGAAPMAAPAQPAVQTAPPPSLASAPGSAGAFQEQVPESAFAYAFGAR